MSHFLSLIRWKNLLIMAVTMFVVVWVSISGLEQGAVLVLKPLDIGLLILSTVLIAAAGYIINDYIDRKIDAVNRPDAQIIGKIISTRKALVYYILGNVLGFVLALYLALKIAQPLLILISISCIILLFAYSYYFKKKLIIGNVLVALLTAISILQYLVFEPAFYPYFQLPIISSNQKINPVYFVLFIAVFAFLLNWIREIIKDLEDMEGDRQFQCTTFPIVMGIQATQNLIRILSIILGVLMLFCLIFYIKNGVIWISGLFLIFFIVLGKFLHSLPQEQTAKHYEKLSKIIKALMLLGLVIIVLITQTIN